MITIENVFEAGLDSVAVCVIRHDLLKAKRHQRISEAIITSKGQAQFYISNFIFNYYAFSLVVDGTDLIADGTYVQVSLDQVTQTRSTTSGTSTITTSSKSISYSKWGTAFDSIDKTKATQLGISSFYCPSSTDYSIKGTYYSDEYIYIQLNIKRWTTGSWKTNSEITTKLTNARVQMAIINSYIDFSDYSTPLRHNIDDGNYWDLVPGYNKKTDIFVQRNYGDFQDGVFVYDDQITNFFYQIINTKDRFELESSTDKILLQTYFRRDDERVEYRRKVYTLLDALGKIGGIFKIVAAVFDLILLLFVENLFYSHMISRLYQLEDNHERVYLTDSSDYNEDKNNGRFISIFE